MASDKASSNGLSTSVGGGKSPSGPDVNRRRFLTGAAVAGVATTVSPPSGLPGSSPARAQTPKAAPPSAAAMLE